MNTIFGIAIRKQMVSVGMLGQSAIICSFQANWRLLL